MKKTLILALIAVFAMSGMAFAANRVEVKVTSEPIQYKSLCDKGGGFTLEWDTDSTILDGDVITIDLDFGVTLCREIDLEISAGGAGGEWTAANIPDATTGAPILDPTGAAITVGTGAYFRLFGAVGTQRITLSVLNDDGDGDGNDGVQVGAGVNDTLILYFLDQKTNPVDFVTQAGIYTDLDNNFVYTDVATTADNVLCINVSQWNQNTVNGNMDSRNDKFTFIPSNPQIAHVVSQVVYDVVECVKARTGRIIMGGEAGQGGNDTCYPFDWDDNEGYCSFTNSDTNLFVVETQFAGTYYDQGEFQVRMEILTDGVYWTNEYVYAESFGNSDNACQDGWASDAVGDVVNYLYWDRDGNPASPFDLSGPDDGACEFDPDAVELLTDCDANVIDAGNHRAISINIPALKYELDEIDVDDEVIVEITLIKCPCGVVWTKQVNLGEFGCEEAGVSFDLLYPYATPMVNDTYWDGFVVTNIGPTDGQATLYFWETDGDQASMVVSVPAGQMFVSMLSQMYSAPVGGQVVQAMTQIGGSGEIGDARLYIVACTDFSCDGFLFMGRSQDPGAKGESMGYLPRDNKRLCSGGPTFANQE